MMQPGGTAPLAVLSTSGVSFASNSLVVNQVVSYSILCCRDSPMDPNPPASEKKNFFTRLLSNFGRVNSGMNHDFCPWANRYVYWLKDPIGWVASGAAFSALVGFLVGPQGFVLMWSFLALLAVGAAWPWLSMKRLDCRLVFDRARVSENGLATATVEITNKWPIPVFGLMVEGEFLLDLVEDDRVAVGLQKVPGWSISKFSWEFRPKQRGVLPVDEPILSNGFPFGLYQAKKDVQVERQTIVWPSDCKLKGTPELAGTQFNISGMMSDRPGIDGDVIGVRQYRAGDSLKHVHWAKTAMLGRLIVQERQTCAQKPIEVILDLTSDHHLGNGSQSSFEWAIRAAASICGQLHRHQSHVELVCVGLPENSLHQITNVNGIKPVFDFLAKLPQLAESKESSENFRKSTSVRSRSGQVKRFVICTNRSRDLLNFTNCEKIILDADGFGQNRTRKIQSNDWGTIHLNSPSTAQSELQRTWEKGVSHGA
ncbi:MAG: DUF58 domain-containing protein [Planctomycetota bacterium]